QGQVLDRCSAGLRLRTTRAAEAGTVLRGRAHNAPGGTPWTDLTVRWWRPAGSHFEGGGGFTEPPPLPVLVLSRQPFGGTTAPAPAPAPGDRPACPGAGRSRPGGRAGGRRPARRARRRRPAGTLPAPCAAGGRPASRPGGAARCRGRPRRADR